MKKLLLIATACVASLSLSSQEVKLGDLNAESADQASVVQNSAQTIELFVRQNDFDRVAVSASAPVPEAVDVVVVVWHYPPGVYTDEQGIDITTFTIRLNPGDWHAHEVLALGGMKTYIVDGVYSAAAHPVKYPGKAQYTVKY